MSSTAKLEAPSHPLLTDDAGTDSGSPSRSSSVGSGTPSRPRMKGEHALRWRAVDEDEYEATSSGIRSAPDALLGITHHRGRDHRWLLYLQATDSHDKWHLFRIDRGAPEHPPVDLTPLPHGSRVFTVDVLATVPGTVLVTMNMRPDFIDYFLIDVATGETTAYLPAGPLESTQPDKGCSAA